MPVVYVKNELYDRIIKAGMDPKQYVNHIVEENLDKLSLQEQIQAAEAVLGGSTPENKLEGKKKK